MSSIQLSARTLLPLLLSNVLLLATSVSSTITIAGTGERFPSQPDPLLGNRWMEGFEYMARMQRLEGVADTDLCTLVSGHNATITVPSDGLPVVLLVRADGCSSDATKVETALSNMHPKGVVKYLVIYTSPPLPPDIRTAHAPERPLRRLRTVIGVHAPLELVTPRAGGSVSTGIVNVAQLDWRGDDYATRVGVLHVTFKTGNDLANILMYQDPTTHAYGGPRVLLDGNSSSDHPFLRNLLFWIGLTLMLSGCVCSFCLSVWLQDTEPPPAPARPERRRLTRAQVESRLPAHRRIENAGDSSDTPCECSICLDDFEEGDLVRKLPCNHEYHSECIVKWLVERHSTCPLCKLDLLIDEEEEESEDDEENDDASIIDNADADRHDAAHDTNRQSFFSHLLANLPWHHQTATIQDVDVDPTPLLHDDGS